MLKVITCFETISEIALLKFDDRLYIVICDNRTEQLGRDETNPR